MLNPDQPALVLAPMDGVTDPPMRAVQGEVGAFTFAVSEFLRVSEQPIPAKVFHRDVPELLTGGRTASGLPVQVQILGGDPERMALSAFNAWKAGAQAIDVNFGCPAPTVNRNDGGASVLRCPPRVRSIMAAIRAALPANIPLSAKLRLGWDSVEEIHENAAMAAEGGASWLTIHARTKVQKYAPPVFWRSIGEVRQNLKPLPVVANGDVWTVEDFLRCQEETGCRHFMLGRGALARPGLAQHIARELGLPQGPPVNQDWESLLRRLSFHSKSQPPPYCHCTLHRLKQWLNFASRFGGFAHFDRAKRCQTEDALFALLAELAVRPKSPFRTAPSHR
jgi:tRNA-dihydrouridine synthase C